MLEQDKEQKISDTVKVVDNGVSKKMQDLVMSFYGDELREHTAQGHTQEYTQERHSVTLTCSCNAKFGVNTIIPK